MPKSENQSFEVVTVGGSNTGRSSENLWAKVDRDCGEILPRQDPTGCKEQVSIVFNIEAWFSRGSD